MATRMVLKEHWIRYGGHAIRVFTNDTKGIEALQIRLDIEANGGHEQLPLPLPFTKETKKTRKGKKHEE